MSSKVGGGLLCPHKAEVHSTGETGLESQARSRLMVPSAPDSRNPEPRAQPGSRGKGILHPDLVSSLPLMGGRDREERLLRAEGQIHFVRI